MEIHIVYKKDYKKLSNFLIKYKNYGVNFWMNRFKLWWDNNPAFEKDFPRGWYIEENKIVVGFLGNIPSKMMINNVVEIVFSATSWFVLPSHRSVSINLFLKWFIQSKNHICFNTTVTANVQKILTAFKFRKWPVNDLKQYFIPINVNNLVIYKIRNSRFNIITKSNFCLILLNFLSKLIEYILRKKKIFKIIKSNYVAKQIFKFDISFDYVWLKTKKKFNLNNVRDLNYLNWYCFNSIDNKLVFSAEKNQLGFGYIICKLNKFQNLKILEILDFWALKNDEKVFNCLVHEIINFSKKNEIDLITNYSYSEYISKLLFKLGFYKISSNKNKFYFLSKSIIKSDINLTSSSGDYGL